MGEAIACTRTGQLGRRLAVDKDGDMGISAQADIAVGIDLDRRNGIQDVCRTSGEGLYIGCDIVCFAIKRGLDRLDLGSNVNCLDIAGRGYGWSRRPGRACGFSTLCRCNTGKQRNHAQRKRMICRAAGTDVRGPARWHYWHDDLESRGVEPGAATCAAPGRMVVFFCWRKFDSAIGGSGTH